MQVPRKERTHPRTPRHIWIVASSSARRASLSTAISKCFHSGTTQVLSSAGFSPSRIAGAADIVVAELENSVSASALIRFLEQAAAQAGFVALIDDPEPRWVQSALKSGMNAIISRESGTDELRLALEAAEAGLVLLQPTTARGLLPSLVAGARLEYDQEQLTPRETEVLRLLSEGLGNKEIASRLAMSEHTAKFHISSILGKLSVATRTEAVSQGIRRGLIPI